MKTQSAGIALGIIAATLVGCSGGHVDDPIAAQPEPETLQQTLTLPSAAQAANTPGTPGVAIDNPALIAQFDGAPVDLNQAIYTRYYVAESTGSSPQVVLVLVPGFEGGASTFAVLADNLVQRAYRERGLLMEVWAIDRRSNLLEDTVGLDLAETNSDPLIGLDFLFGDELGLTLHPTLAAGPNRRANFYNSGAETAFMAGWTPLVHSFDIDAVIEAALSHVGNGNVFLGGHSAGTGFTARYAATDFDLDTTGVEAGYGKLRGLVLLEGGGSSLAQEPGSEAELDAIEAEFDGGLYGAILNQAPRCADGTTPCTVDTAAVDCAALSIPVCTEPRGAYAEVPGLLSPQLFAISEVNALDAEQVGDGVQSILQRDFGTPGNNAVQQVPQLQPLTLLLGDQAASSASLLGQFLDDDGAVAGLASFVATSVGAPGPAQNGVDTWISKGEGIPDAAKPDNGPAPSSPSQDSGGNIWGMEAEPSDLEGRMLPIFYRGQTNFSDWYYPSSGLGIGRTLGLDTTSLSAPPPAGRGRTDIANQTQATNIDIPVIAFGGSNGLTPIPANWLGFADAIAPCAAASCDGTTPRVLDRQNPNEAFPTFGGIGGGFEVYISEGYAHVDIVTADDETGNEVIAPLLDFLLRNQN